MANWSDIITLSVVEGITEFLPVSSTGHMIVASKLLGIEDSDQLSAFLVIVQAGAILAVVSVYFKLFREWITAWFSFGKKDIRYVIARQQSISVFVSVLPFAVVGFILKDFIKSLFSPIVVGYALVVGGLLIIAVERLLNRLRPKEKNFSKVTLRDSFIVGAGQCLALWPGFSRSAATILTGRLLGYSRASAAELSFVIGMPTLLGTATYEALKEWRALDAQWLIYLGVGIIISWFVAYLCVKGFIAFLQRFSLTGFAIYRILVGILILWYFNQPMH